MGPGRAIHRSGFARAAQDFYPTPTWVTEALLRHVPLRGPIWEPCCGTGAMSEVLAAQSHRVVSTDLVDQGYGTGGIDIFECHALPDGCVSLVTNPPYGDVTGETRSATALLRFVRHAMALVGPARGQLALLVRFQWLAGKGAAALLSSGPFTDVIVLTRRIRWFDRGELTNTAQHHHAWVVLDYDRAPGGGPVLRFDYMPRRGTTRRNTTPDLFG